MKSRRCTAQYLPCFQTKGIAHLGTAALRDSNPVYFSRITSRIDDLTKRLPPELIQSSVPTKRSVRDGWKRWRRLANRRDVSASSSLALSVPREGPDHRLPRQRPSPTNDRSFSFLLSQWTLRLTLRVELGGEDYAPFQRPAVSAERFSSEEERSAPLSPDARSHTENDHPRQGSPNERHCHRGDLASHYSPSSGSWSRRWRQRRWLRWARGRSQR